MVRRKDRRPDCTMESGAVTGGFEKIGIFSATLPLSPRRPLGAACQSGGVAAYSRRLANAAPANRILKPMEITMR